MTAAAACWGAATVTTKISLEQLGPTDVFVLEVLVGAASLVAILVLRGGRLLPAAPWGFVALGVLEPGLSFALFDLGLSRTGATDGAILLASDGLIGALLGWLVLHERITLPIAAALGAGFVGTVLVALTPTMHASTIEGDVLILCATVMTAAYGVAARRLTQGADTLAATGIQVSAAAVTCVPLAAATHVLGPSHLHSADAAHLLAVAATGLLGSAIPLLLFNLAIRRVTVAASAVTLNLVPVIAAGLAIALLGERPGWPVLAGGAMVIGAALALTHRVRDVAP